MEDPCIKVEFIQILRLINVFNKKTHFLPWKFSHEVVTLTSGIWFGCFIPKQPSFFGLQNLRYTKNLPKVHATKIIGLMLCS